MIVELLNDFNLVYAKTLIGKYMSDSLIGLFSVS